jgi:hypothetical protein
MARIAIGHDEASAAGRCTSLEREKMLTADPVQAGVQRQLRP